MYDARAALTYIFPVM